MTFFVVYFMPRFPLPFGGLTQVENCRSLSSHIWEAITKSPPEGGYLDYNGQIVVYSHVMPPSVAGVSLIIGADKQESSEKISIT
jgi:hypothetical protein